MVGVRQCAAVLALVGVIGCGSSQSAVVSASSGPVESSSCPVRVHRDTISPRNRIDDPAALELRIQRAVVKAEATPGVPYVRLTFHNRSSEVLWINRFLVAAACEECQVEFDMVHEDTGERPVSAQCMARRRRVGRDDYLLLSPGDEFSTVVGARCLVFRDKGPWRTVARYRDALQEPFAPPPGAKWFSGEVLSNEIDLEVPFASSEPSY